LPLTTQATLLSLSRSSLYYQAVAPSAREVAIKHRIDEIYMDALFYGSRKIQVLLRPEFGTLARNTVRRYMQEMGIAAIYPGPNLSRRHQYHVYPHASGLDVSGRRAGLVLALCGPHPTFVSPATLSENV